MLRNYLLGLTMVFNSLFFFITLLSFLLLQRTLISRKETTKLAKYSIVLYSFIFYGMWNPWFLIPLVLSAYIDYKVALAIFYGRASQKKLLLSISLISNLGLLAFFKYYNFFALSSSSILSILGLKWDPSLLKVILPVGLSFYTFEALSYTIDVYRGLLEPRKNFLDVILFISFFPHLVAGPIVRARQLMPQFDSLPRARRDAINNAIFLIILGLFLKCVLADNTAVRVNALFGSWQTNSVSQNWAAGTLFGVQIYGDFAGYSAIAIGIARLMGYTIPANFRFPFGALGFQDFWRRWHISLSSWLRDYLYITLGGNQKGKIRTHINLLLTMLLGGLWHGASYMFLLWGGLHGLFLSLERIFKMPLSFLREKFRIPKIFVTLVGILFTYLVVSLTWIPFRASSFVQCQTMLIHLFKGSFSRYPEIFNDFLVVTTVFIWDSFWARRNFMYFIMRYSSIRCIAITGMLLALYYYSGDRNVFIYFQF